VLCCHYLSRTVHISARRIQARFKRLRRRCSVSKADSAWSSLSLRSRLDRESAFSIAVSTCRILHSNSAILNFDSVTARLSRRVSRLGSYCVRAGLEQRSKFWSQSSIFSFISLTAWPFASRISYTGGTERSVKLILGKTWI
jgi:hypothetical protein